MVGGFRAPSPMNVVGLLEFANESAFAISENAFPFSLTFG